MTRQGARRKWPGLAGLSDERQRKPTWWAGHGDQFARCARAVLAALPEGPRPAAAAHACGLLAALTADAYAAMNSHSSLLSREDLACEADGCPREPAVELWRPDFGHRPAPACPEHAAQALGQPAIRIVAAYQPDIALSVFTQAHSQS
jgi:hypothetical protein